MMPHFAEPLWFLILVPLVAALFLRPRHVHFIRKSAYGRGEVSGGFSRFAPPRLFFAVALVALVVALGDPVRGFTSVTEDAEADRIIASVDNSSSMYGFADGDPIFCTDDGLEYAYPRIYVGCRALHRFIDTVENAALRQKGDARHLIGIIRFALYSKVQSYPTNDYVRLRIDVDEMNWRLRGDLGIYTEIHSALRDMFLMALERNRSTVGGDMTHLTMEDMNTLARSLKPNKTGRNLSPSVDRFSPPRALLEKLARIKEELRDTIFVIFTDAHPGQLEERLHKNPVSFQKLIELAALLELPVYIISTDEPNAEFQRLMRQTGFGPEGGPDRGDFYTIKQGGGINLDSVDALVMKILETRLGRTVPVVVERRESYAHIAVLIALTLILCGVLWRETVLRSLTET